ncbi:MAG: diguanylate cyclase [Planctomycetota bacterium]|nr:diguanylate cyclase [Planctomycetota bacterium]
MISRKFDELRLTGGLPSPSAIGLRILAITEGEDYDQRELESTIMADPALAGRILKLANAAIHDRGAPLTSVPQAAMRLGARSVRTVALGFTLISDNRAGSSQSFDYDAFWSHALATAAAAANLAHAVTGVESAEAFTCGLLADVGRLALASVHPERYSALVEGAPGASGLDLAHLETQAFDIDHYEVGAALLEDWGLPELFQNAILLYEREDAPVEEGAVDDLVRVLRCSKRVADVLQQREAEPTPEETLALLRLGHAAEELGMETVRFLGACDSTALAWREWGAVLGIPAGVAGTISGRYAAAVRAPAPEVKQVQLVDPESLERAISPPDLESTSTEESDELPTRILLVDDDERMLKLISHHLRREGYDVLTSGSSQEGLATALAKQPQLVITDWMMPGMTGLELCKTLRQSEPGRRMYVLVVTAREDDERVVEAFAAGADDYIVKPFNPRILLARVKAGQRMVRMREKVEAAERTRLRQVAELGILTRKLRAAAMTDALTELPNRRYAMKRLKQEWESSLRTGRPLSVVLADIDHFKQVNDRFGHDTGDAVLREVATLLRRVARSGEVLCRIGGEEFLCIERGSTAEDAAKGAERLRAAAEELEVKYPGFEGRVTLSLGVAQRTDQFAGVDDLIKAADDALYVAKGAGRNQVAVHRDDADSGRRSA